MKRILILALTCSVLPVAAFAQTAPAAGGQTGAPAAAAQGAAPANPLSTTLKMQFARVAGYIAKSAEKMPEENYAFKPTPEVRSFGELLGHIANSNYAYCSRSKGEPNPNQGNDFEKKTAKADLLKAVADSNAYCDGVYGSMTDQTAVELIKAGQNMSPRMAGLIANFGHDDEHYGNLVTYMRLKGIVPPSSEPRK